MIEHALPGCGRWAAPVLLLLLGSQGTASSAELEGWLRALEGPEGAPAAFERLAALGPEAAAAALRGFAEAPREARRLRAELVAERGDAALADELARVLDDPEPAVRTAWVRFLARPDHAERARVERIALLVRLADEDVGGDVRRAAFDALGALDDPQAVEALARAIATLPPTGAAAAARSLPASARSSALVSELVSAGFAPRPPSRRTPDPVLAAVLPLHGRLLADRAGGGESASELSPLALGLRHPSPEVRAAAAAAFEGLLARLRAVGEADRALRILDALGGQGLDRRIASYHRARIALWPGADPEAALEAARAMRGGRGARRGAGSADVEARSEERLWLHRSIYLEGMARFAAGDVDGARDRLDDAAAVLETSLAERLDLADDALASRHLEALRERALVEVARALVALGDGARFDDERVLALGVSAHRLALEAQLLAARLFGETIDSWDALFDSEASPFRLVFTGVDLPGLDVERGLALQHELGRLFASVARREMPGFEPAEGLAAEVADPIADPERRALLERVQGARLDWIREEIRRLTARVRDVQRTAPGVVPVRELGELEALELRRRLVLRSMAEDEERAASDLRELRVPASLALWLARDLRAENRPRDARRLAEAMRDDLERVGFSNWWYYQGTERLAQVEIAIGASYTDEGDAAAAERVLLAAVERLEGIERRMEEAGAAASQLEAVRAVRSTALVSLAVNANVKMRDPERALAYYERAYELRQDDFMRVLLACYRARSGREAEARALLREIRPYPQLFYNLACTHALLGDVERALAYLERDFEENLSSDAARQRQREWAREDPDLERLRGDPRFERIVGPG